MKTRVVSGIKPTGSLHIGNYLGTLKKWLELQDNPGYECLFFIADLHALTGNMSADDRRTQILTLAAEIIAAGIDPDKSTLYIQSDVPACTELTWIFSTVTPVAELQRMTQYKDQALVHKKNVNAGLLYYPVLMAADVLLYHADMVPVGEDQVQHLELARDIARWYSNRYGEYFKEVHPMLTDVPKVKSLLDPEKKMSKSKGAGHVIELADAPEVIAEKIKKAVTASDGEGAAPGVENLLMLLDHFGAPHEYKEFAEAYAKKDIQYSALKAAVSKSLADYFAEFRIRRSELLDTHNEVAEILIQGAKKASAIAEETMTQVRKQVGLR